jgi:anti-sigma regulatory factor (Ser/Thr protein kinase)
LDRAKHQGDEGWVVPTAQVSVAAEPRSASVVRRFVRETLSSWDAQAYTDAAELVVTELVTNAVLHAKTEIVVRVDLGREGLRLEVIDRSPRRPIARHYSAEATTGRGLGLVAAVADRWGVQPDRDGKTVWAELASNRASQPAVPPLTTDHGQDGVRGTGQTDHATERPRAKAA